MGELSAIVNILVQACYLETMNSWAVNHRTLIAETNIPMPKILWNFTLENLSRAKM